MKRFVKKFLIKAVALIILISLYSLTRLPSLNKDEEKELLKDFSFIEKTLYEPGNSEAKSIRNVHPQYQKISSWISSVGAAVTLTDIDGNGLSNDIIHVDPRYDAVLISPANATSTLYTSFILRPGQLLYDSLSTAPMGTLANDFNSDGQMDVLVYYWGRSPIIFYQTQNGFIEKELSTTYERWFTNAATLADFDGDGNTDILLTNYFPDGSRVLDANAKEHDQTMQHSMSRAYNGGKDHFFLFNGFDNEFAKFIENTDCRKDVDHAEDWTLAVAAADINNDQLPEIYFANDFGPDKLLYNLSTPGHLRFKQLYGARRFTDIRSGVLGKDSFKGMGACFGDINGDGLVDIYVSNIAANFALQESHFVFINTGEFDKMKEGIAPFVNESEKLGLSRSSWSWDCKFADFNNDGVLEAVQATGFVRGVQNKWAELQEVAIGNDELLAKTEVWPDLGVGTDLSGHDHNYLFVRGKSGKYQDIALRLGIDMAHITRGLAVGDKDHDGDVDLITANQWETSYEYENNYKGKNSFLGLRIMQTVKAAALNKNKSSPENNTRLKFAIGASVKVILPDKKIIPGYVDGGNGHSGKNSNEVFFGLGNIAKDQKLDVVIQYRDIKGIVKQEVFQLIPGWHTIILQG